MKLHNQRASLSVDLSALPHVAVVMLMLASLALGALRIVDWYDPSLLDSAVDQR